MTNLIMCPAHLVHHWEREITDRAPRSKAIIIKDLNQLINLMPMLTGKKKRHEHIWLILSKETAKLGYILRPAAVWREHKKIPGQNRFGVYCCPHCGKPLFYQTKEGTGRNKRTVDHFLTETSFRAPSVKKNNLQCLNYIEKKEWNTETGDWRRLTRCNCNLWTVSTRETLWSGPDDDPTKWLKLGGSAGWVQRCNVERIQEQILAQDDHTADDLQLLAQLQNIINGEVPVQVAPRKYPISKYIRRYLKGKIDYFIADEVHGYKGADSLQGEAAGDLIFAAKHVLGLTGTLLNGYSSGIYYLLFRMFAKKMKAEGYKYDNDTPFIKDYGVTQQTTWFSQRYGRYDDVSSRGKIKELPGVSPIVFTKFLLENAAFLSLEDITEGLPGYEEIPVALDMPWELAEAYEDLKQQFDAMFDRSDIKAHKCVAQAVQLLSVFPDQPYDQPSVIDPDTGNVAIASPSLTTEYREKETALLEIIQRKVEAGEHVLVYYTWTNRTDVAQRLSDLLTSHGYKIANLTTQIKATDRETWINKQIANGAQVLLCNPTLVETGLTLLDFTTIIYYQFGYNLYTMRQASRRSWRINQDHDVQVYFLYYKDTVQETALALMATKLQAAMAIEGKFSEDGLNAMSNNEDLLTQIAGSVTEGIKDTVDPQVFKKTKIVSQRKVEQVRKKIKRVEYKEAPYSPKNRTGFDPATSEFMRSLNL